MTDATSICLRDLAVFVRSKNAGPFMMTIDLFFEGPEPVARVLASGVLTPETVAGLYGVPAGDVRVIHFAQADAIKISFPRPLAAGDVGDNDVAGGQQFLPLLDVAVPGEFARAV